MAAFDMEKAKAFVRNKEQKRQATLQQRLLQAQADFDAIAAILSMGIVTPCGTFFGNFRY